MEIVIVILAFIAFAGFRQWLQHQRRAMIHRERLAAVEKGVAIPPLDQEVRRSNWNVQRFLLLAGLIWISLGVGSFVVLNALLAHPEGLTDLHPGVQWIGIAPMLIGLSHLLVYLVGRRIER
jgi:small-conductance mechanosensitive channel